MPGNGLLIGGGIGQGISAGVNAYLQARKQRLDEQRENAQMGLLQSRVDQESENQRLERERRESEFGSTLDLHNRQLEETAKHNRTTEGLLRSAAQKKEEKLPPDEQAFVNTLSGKNANKASIANQIKSYLSDWDTLADDQKLARGRQMIKVLNSSEGQDAVGAEEAKRLASKLEFAMGNLFNDNPIQFGRDLPGFKKQAEGTMESLLRGVDANTGQIEKVTGRKSRLGLLSEGNDPEEGMTATNKKTGERLIKRGGKWVPLK